MGRDSVSVAVFGEKYVLEDFEMKRFISALLGALICISILITVSACGSKHPIEEFRNKKVFVFSDIQKLIAVFGALFFFAVFVSEFSPLIVKIFEKILTFLVIAKGVI